jgi:hypothetical protein
MGVYKVSDNAATTLANALTNSPSVTSLIMNGTVDIFARFPVINHGGTGSDWTYVTLYDAAGNTETVKVTRRDTGSGTLTIVRGTAAGINGVTDASCKAWASGSTGVACRLIAQTVNDLYASQTATEASAAATAASAAEAVANIQAFEDQYLGPKASDPSVDNLGGALAVGNLYFNTTTNSMKVWNGSAWQIPVPPANVFAYEQKFSGNDSTTVFTLSNAPSIPVSVQVFISGVRQYLTSDYTISGTTLTFVTAPPAGTNNVYAYWTTPIAEVAAIGTALIDNNAITNAKLADGAVGVTAKLADRVVSFAKTVAIATNKLLGRSTASSGDIEEISIGSGLSLSGGTLSCTVSAPVSSVFGRTGAVSLTSGDVTGVGGALASNVVPTDVGANGIGCFAFAYYGGNVNNGFTVDGASLMSYSLQPVDPNGGGTYFMRTIPYSGLGSGTWRNVGGYIASGGFSTFQRIA